MMQMRTGLLARNGMTRIFRDDGSHVPVTVLHLDAVQVVAARTQEKDGYTAVQLGWGQGQGEERSKPNKGISRQGEGRAEGEARRVPRGARRAAGAGGDAVGGAFRGWPESRCLRHHQGQGFCGIDEAPEFLRKLEASHGVSISHRSHGSTGNR